MQTNQKTDYKKESAEKYQKNERKDYAVADCRPNMFKQVCKIYRFFLFVN